MGKFRGAMVPAIFPIAGNFPIIRLGNRTTGRSRTTTLTTSQTGCGRRPRAASAGCR
jgi:hypothetical protein